MGDVSPRDYYARQLKVPGWGPEGQERLGRSKVLVVGVGGLGCPALSALARSGVGHLVFCDPDRVEASNLPRQSLFTAADVGRQKADAAAAALRAANPWIRLKPRSLYVDARNVRALVEEADVVIDGTDNFATKFLVHDACRAAGKPLVTASLYQWEAQILVFPFQKNEPGCWRCLWPEAPQDGCVGVCADVGVAGALAGIAGNFQALAAVRLLLGLQAPPACTTWIIDADDWTPRRLAWRPRPDCSCTHAKGDWSWLTVSPAETDWDSLGPEDRTVVVDVRQPEEIDPAEWEFFKDQGSQVLHFPWADWDRLRPAWDPAQTYLIVCAHGIRSASALRTVPQEIRALSLAGGTAALSHTLERQRAAFRTARSSS